MWGVNYYLLLVLELFIKKLLSKDNPNACQNVIDVNPKISGINQFHNHIIGNDVNTPINTAVPITTKTFTNTSIIIYLDCNIQ